MFIDVTDVGPLVLVFEVKIFSLQSLRNKDIPSSLVTLPEQNFEQLFVPFSLNSSSLI